MHRVEQNVKFSKFKPFKVSDDLDEQQVSSFIQVQTQIKSKDTGEYSPLSPSKTIGVRVDLQPSKIAKVGSSSSVGKNSPKPKLSGKSTFAKKP